MNFKDANHLFRLAAVFAAGFLMFVLVRGFLVPKSFGQYGHFRGNALAEIKSQPVHYAGHETCESCHSDVLEQKTKGKHVRVNCEACHGPLAKHAEDPGDVAPEKLDTAKLCVRCHEANTAKPKWFPQVVSADHANGLACSECHKPHSPAIAAEENTASAATPSKAAPANKGAKK
jgi:Cytochrome c7 and related cytochrome c